MSTKKTYTVCDCPHQAEQMTDIVSAVPVMFRDYINASHHTDQCTLAIMSPFLMLTTFLSIVEADFGEALQRIRARTMLMFGQAMREDPVIEENIRAMFTAFREQSELNVDVDTFIDICKIDVIAYDRLMAENPECTESDFEDMREVVRKEMGGASWK